MEISEDFTVDEKNAIQQLRTKLENDEANKCDLLYDDLILFKFLKGCSFNSNQAEQMLKKHIKWRRIYQVDRILQDYKALEIIELYLSQSFLGFDKEGSVIRYSAAGNVDIEGILTSVSIKDVLKSVVHLIETDIRKSKDQTKKTGKSISQFVYIYNLEKLTVAKAINRKNLEFFKLGTSLFQDNYPERLKSIYVINAPPFYTLLFALAKSVLSIGLLKKIKLFGHRGWQEALLEIIDENVLPAFLGGKRTDPDGNPLCNTFVVHGGLVPEKYYLFNNKDDFKNSQDVRKLMIKKQAVEELDIMVEKDGSYIEWEFQIEQKDIGFGLSLRCDMQDTCKLKEVIPVHRVHTSEFPENGRYYCEKSGNYVVILDNSYSLWTAKEIFIKILTYCEK